MATLAPNIAHRACDLARKARPRWRAGGLGLAGALLLLAAPTFAAERIVSIGGSVTEIVYALGAGDRLVAVDSTSLYPPAATELPDVGYMRRLSAEPILAMAPDLVLAIEDSGPPNILEQLRAAGVEVLTIADQPTPRGVVAKIGKIADVLDLKEAGATLAHTVDGAFATLARDEPAPLERRRIMFLLNSGRGLPLVAGRNTAADGIIHLAGGQNAVEGYEGYKPLSPEAAIQAAPDVILCMDHTVQMMGGADAILALPDLALTPAGRHRRLISMDGLLLLGFGPRTPDAARALAARLQDGDRAHVD